MLFCSYLNRVLRSPIESSQQAIFSFCFQFKKLFSLTLLLFFFLFLCIIIWEINLRQHYILSFIVVTPNLIQYNNIKIYRRFGTTIYSSQHLRSCLPACPPAPLLASERAYHQQRLSGCALPQS